jgi:hypothetical protein
MITHIVAWKLKETAAGSSKWENAQELKELLESLNGKIPGMDHLEVGIDISKTEISADVVLYSRFESREALGEFPKHPEHLKIKPFIQAVRDDRILIDYEN